MPATAVPAPSLRRSMEAKRQLILQAGKAEFLRFGFGGTSMDMVAATANVSKMTVYRHFGSKEELFAGVITQLCEQTGEAELHAESDESPADALRRFARRTMATIFAPETVELHRIVIAESTRFPELGKLFYRSGPDASIAMLAAYLSRNRKNSAFRVSDPRRTAEEFLELLRGYAHLRVLLGLGTAPSARETQRRIDSALRHVLVTD